VRPPSSAGMKVANQSQASSYYYSALKLFTTGAFARRIQNRRRWLEMRKALLTIAVLSLAMIIVSCSAFQTLQTSRSRLQPGMTKNQVREEIGSPSRSIRTPSGEEVWSYYYNPLGQVYAGASSTSARLQVAFRRSEVVDWQVDQ